MNQDIGGDMPFLDLVYFTSPMNTLFLGTGGTERGEGLAEIILLKKNKTTHTPNEKRGGDDFPKEGGRLGIKVGLESGAF